LVLFTLLLVIVVVLAMVGLGWKTFSDGVINGFERVIDIGTPLVKGSTLFAVSTSTRMLQ